MVQKYKKIFMKLMKFIARNFDDIWSKYCTEEIGYKILGKEEFSSDSAYPIIWGSDSELGVKILIFFSPYPARYVTTVFLWVDKIKYPMRRKVPMRVKSCVKNIGDFHFSKNELADENIQYVLENKCNMISDPVIFNRLVATACRASNSSNKDREPRSIRAIPSGLYGLGKNRRH